MTSSPTLNTHGLVVNLLHPSGTYLESWKVAQQGKNITCKNYLNIFEIIELFRKEKDSTEVEIRQLMDGRRDNKEKGIP